MAKPSVVHFAIGVVMLRRDWLARYMPDFVRQNVPENILVGSRICLGGADLRPSD